MWGWLSDRWGRRPVLLLGLIGNTICGSLFGLSKSLKWAIVTRSLCGLLNGKYHTSLIGCEASHLMSHLLI
jgi:MFS family permease